MKEGKIHATLTTLIALTAVGLWIADGILLKPDDKLRALCFVVSALIIIFTLIFDVHYVEPDYGLGASEEHPILFGHPGWIRKPFFDYTPAELWSWRISGYAFQLIFFAPALILFLLR
jgi:hypothetical protein